ncbi:TPA: glycosyltransferase [Candidatus Sumerlaeota bacterium]|nr:glycosyltransferase [Candidatus Sumerlaeota bacterium]
MKKISFISPCYNEEDNIQELVERIGKVMEALPQYTYEHVLIDNASKDKTVEILRQIARDDKHVKVIVNMRNFGHIRSPFYGMLQCTGDAIVYLASDLQDPPEMVPDFIKKWEEGYKIVLAVKDSSAESPLFFLVRKFYYHLIGKLSEIDLIKNATGFGLYDKRVMDIAREIDDPYPYFRGLICDLGFEIATLKFHQPARKRGFTKNNFYTLLDIALLGITNHSKVPLRLATMTGFCLGTLSLLVAFIYLVCKLIFWQSFQMGMAPLIISMFFFSAVQLFFIGIVGEYIGSIHTQVLKRPLVVEKERINFDNDENK